MIKLDKETTDRLKQMIAITIQNTISKLGFMPEDFGDKAKKILASENVSALMKLGCILDECVRIGNYTDLSSVLKKIPDDKI